MTTATVELRIREEDEPIVGTSRKIQKKTAQKDAAQKVLAKLESAGFVHTYKKMPQVILPISEVSVMKGDPQVTSQGHPWAYKIMPQVCLPISEVSAMRADPKVTSRGHPTALVHGAADVQNIGDCSFASQPHSRCSSPSNTLVTSTQIVEQEVMPGLQDSAEPEESMGFEDAHSKASHQAAGVTTDCKLSLHVETVYIESNPLGLTCMSNTPARNLLSTVITSPVVESALDLTKPEASNQVQDLGKTEDVVEEICSELMSPKSLSTGLAHVSTPPTPDPGVEHVQVSAAASKRKLDGKEKETTEAQKQARYFWSREESKGQTTTTANIIHITETANNNGEPIEVNACPWSGPTSDLALSEVQRNFAIRPPIVLHQGAKKVKESSTVVIQASTSTNSAQECVPKTSPLPLQQPLQSGRCASMTYPKNTGKLNCRQSLNDLCIGRKWAPPKFDLELEQGEPHARWFTFSVAVIVEAEKEKLKCLGKAQKDKKQARESAASAMLSILQERGIFCGS